MAFLLGFFLEATLGMIGFWFLEVSSLLFVYMLFNFFFSGHMFPLTILPAPWDKIVLAQPLPAQYSFLKIEPDNVVVTALKKAEDDNALIVRYFDWAGAKAEVKLAFLGLKKAADSDLMERQIGILAGSAGTVVVPTSPYEIKTVKLETTPSEAK